LDFEVQLEFDGLIELWCCCTLLVAEEYSWATDWVPAGIVHTGSINGRHNFISGVLGHFKYLYLWTHINLITSFIWPTNSGSFVLAYL
jgi:hypothetical protein